MVPLHTQTRARLIDRASLSLRVLGGFHVLPVSHLNIDNFVRRGIRTLASRGDCAHNATPQTAQPSPPGETATLTQRLRPLGHPDVFLLLS
ncbi:hypothetical protein ATANTOWER_032789 [Ataeniobius toweri]|uniref:Uncharacterized protein n=1 Tax=Ataeniobius toweri TaxID=208326 RepID=A0ABU7ARU5_9TELE|nr:hypothetical protein [Ataeniobius toweri]